MKTSKTVTSKKRVIPASKRTVTKITCDFCSEVLPDHGSYGHYWTCDICGRDTCRKHQECDDHGNDYPDWYCIICYPLYMPQYEAMQERHWKEEEKLRAEVKQQSLAERVGSSAVSGERLTSSKLAKESPDDRL